MDLTKMIEAHFHLANELILKNDFEYLEIVLEDLSEFEKMQKRDIKFRVLPKVENYEDYVIFQLKLNDCLKKNDLEDLGYLIQYLKESKITIGNNTFFSPNLWLTVDIKESQSLCFGKACLHDAKLHKPSKLIRLESCKDHTFCRRCLRKYVLEEMRKFGITSIKCEACCLIYEKNMIILEGRSAKKNQNILNLNDLKNVLTKKDLEIYAKDNINKKYLERCSILRCPRKGKLLSKDFFYNFEKCCRKVCDVCYADSTIKYIRSYRNYNHLKNIDSLVGIMCPNSHLISAQILDVNKVMEIISRASKSLTVQETEEITDIYSHIKPLFYRRKDEFCKNCNLYSSTRDLSSFCRRCFKCFYCEDFYHERNECEDLKKLENDKLILSKVASENLEKINIDSNFSPGDQDYYNYVECMKLIPKDYKIVDYYKVKISEKIENMHNRLADYHYGSIVIFLAGSMHETDSTVFREEILTKQIKEVDDKESKPTLYYLYKNSEIKNDSIMTEFYQIIYKCIYQKRQLNTEDKSINDDDKYKLVIFSDYVYNNEYMMIPFRVLKCEKTYHPEITKTSGAQEVQVHK